MFVIILTGSSCHILVKPLRKIFEKKKKKKKQNNTYDHICDDIYDHTYEHTIDQIFCPTIQEKLFQSLSYHLFISTSATSRHRHEISMSWKPIAKHNSRYDSITSTAHIGSCKHATLHCFFQVYCSYFAWLFSRSVMHFFNQVLFRQHRIR